MLPFLKPLLTAGLLASVTLGPAAGQPAQQPGVRKPFPHFRPTEKRTLKHYKPKTWRERAPVAKPLSGGASRR